VVVDEDGTVDEAATENRREEIRSDRLSTNRWGEEAE
jgi:hypothetical protein